MSTHGATEVALGHERIYAARLHPVRLAKPLHRRRQGPFGLAVVVPGGQLGSRAGAVRSVYFAGSRPFFTWLQVSGIETGAPGRPRGDSGATAVDIRSLRR